VEVVVVAVISDLTVSEEFLVAKPCSGGWGAAMAMRSGAIVVWDGCRGGGWGCDVTGSAKVEYRKFWTAGIELPLCELPVVVDPGVVEPYLCSTVGSGGRAFPLPDVRCPKLDPAEVVGREMTNSDLVGVSIAMTRSISSDISSSSVPKLASEVIPIVSPCSTVGARSLHAILDEPVVADDCDLSSAARAGPISSSVRLMRCDSFDSSRSVTGVKCLGSRLIPTGIGGRSIPRESSKLRRTSVKSADWMVGREKEVLCFSLCRRDDECGVDWVAIEKSGDWEKSMEELWPCEW